MRDDENQKRVTRFRKVIDAFHEAIANSQFGFKGVSTEIGKGLSQLYDECNSAPSKATAGKLGWDDGIEIMRLTGNITPLHLTAAELYCRVRPLGALSTEAMPSIRRHLSLDAAVTAFKRLDADNERSEVLIAAMAEIADAAETICALARSRDYGQPVEEAMAQRVLFRKRGNQ